MVIPECNFLSFVSIDKGSHFGEIDLVGTGELGDFPDGKRRFAVRADENSVILKWDKNNMYQADVEFHDVISEFL